MCQYIINLTDSKLLNERDIDGNTPIHLAILHDNETICIFLIDNNVNMDITNNDDLDPFAFSITKQSQKCLKLLNKLFSSSQNKPNNEDDNEEDTATSIFIIIIIKIDPFQYGDKLWGYYLTEKHKYCPINFSADGDSGTWSDYHSFFDYKGRQYYLCTQTNEYSYKDPRGNVLIFISYIIINSFFLLLVMNINTINQ